MEILADPATRASLLTLVVLEIVLGIDNLVFISIMAGRLPEDRQPAARRIGLGLALVSRLALLDSRPRRAGRRAATAPEDGAPVSSNPMSANPVTANPVTANPVTVEPRPATVVP